MPATDDALCQYLSALERLRAAGAMIIGTTNLHERELTPCSFGT